LRVGITYNVKKEIAEEKSLHGNFIDKNLVENYSHRLSDKYAEWDEIETIDAVKSALEKAGHDVILIEAEESAYNNLSIVRPDIVFNVAEGFGGAARESFIPSMLEMLNIPYTASDPVTTGICHDKSRCKEILSFYNLPTPKYLTANSALNGEFNLLFPCFVKPLHEGSSKGIYNSSVVRSTEELNSEIKRIRMDYSQPALIEEYLEGREFTVALLGNGENVKVLPIIEINLGCVPEGFNKIYSYEVKWYFDTRENKLDIFTCPAKISEELKKNIEKICLKAYKVLRLRDWARIDVRCDGYENPYIIEVNPLPGILPNPDDNSCFPRAAREIGLDYDDLINTVLNLALERSELKPTG
jgi:D-alanine-D-alanine ligase